MSPISNYDPILYDRRPISRRAQMVTQNRAKQFAPFDGLKGHMRAMHTQEKNICEQLILDDFSIDILSRQLSLAAPGDFLSVIYFKEAQNPEDDTETFSEIGEYLSFSGTVHSIDSCTQTLKLLNSEDELTLSFDQLLRIPQFQRSC